MPTYLIEGRRIKTEAPLSDAEIDEIAASIKKPVPTASPPTSAEDERSAAGQFTRSAALGMAPSAAAMAGFGVGAANPLALAADPYTLGGASLVSGLIGAGIAAYGAGKAQEKLIEAAPETSKALGITPEQMAAGAEKHKWATKAGEFAPNLFAFELGPEKALLKALAEKETRAAAAKELAKQTATNVGIVGAQDVGSQAMSDRPFDIEQLGEAALTGAVLGRPRGWARKAEAAGRAAATRTVKALRGAPSEPEITPDTRGLPEGEQSATNIEAEPVGAGRGPELPAEQAVAGEPGVEQARPAGLDIAGGGVGEPVGREEGEQAALADTLNIETPKAPDTVRVYHSGSVGEGKTGRWVSTDKAYAKNYRPDLPLFYTDIPANDPRLQGAWPDQGAAQGITFNFELTPEESVKLKPAETPSMKQLRKEAGELVTEPSESKGKSIFKKIPGYEKLAENIQDSRRWLAKIQNDLKVSKKLVTVGEDKNNIADQVSTAVNRAVYAAHTEVDPVVRRLQDSIEDYARASKLPLKQAWEKISGYFIAAHEPLRRETLYLKNKPLNNTVKREFIPGEASMTAARAREILEKRRSSVKDDAEAEQILNSLRDLAANHGDPNGFSPTGEKAVDINDAAYNVIAPEYNKTVIDNARKLYENDPNRPLVDEIRNNLTELHNVSKSLNRRGNYWHDKVENLTKTYGWGNTYIPVKGMPGAERSLESDISYVKGDLAKVPAGFEGKHTEFDDPILQSVADAYTAASRAGRGTDVTDTIKNLIKLGVVKLKNRPKKFTFEERNSPDFDVNETSGMDKIVSHNSDGSIDVYTLADPRQVEAIKSTYREMNPVLNKIGTFTRGIGLMHTRLKTSFAPKNFIRDVITNTFLIAAKENPALAAKYVGSVVSHMLNGGLYKAGRLSRILSGKTPEQLKGLSKTIDSTYRDALEMMEYGGSSLYRKSFDIGNAMETLSKDIGPQKIIKNKGQLSRWIDAWGDAFELSARTGAYSARKNENMSKAKKQGLNINDPKVMEDIKKEAAAFSLSLMDFGKVGKYGKELSALYIFTRPSATAAVNAIDALRPAFEFGSQKAFSKLEPEIQSLYETGTLEEKVKELQQSGRPDTAKIDELNEEIAARKEAFKEFERGHRAKQINALGVAAFTAAAGYALYNMAAAMSGEDEQGHNRVKSDDMSRWTQNLRLPIPGKKDYFQIPWGFGISALMAGGAQIAALQDGTVNVKDFAKNMVSIGADSYLPIPVSRIDPTENPVMWALDSAAPSIAKPFVEFMGNMNSFGVPIYNPRASKYLDAFSGSARASDMHRGISQFMLDYLGMDINPDTVSFVLSSYADGVSSFAENSMNLMRVASGEKDFDPRTDAFILQGLIGTASNYDARKFDEAEQKIQNLSRTVNTLKERGEKERLQKFYNDNPRAEALIATYNKGGEAALKKLYTARKNINQAKGIPPKERKAKIDDVEKSINYIKKNMVQRFEEMGLK